MLCKPAVEQQLFSIVSYLVPMLLSLTVHEYCHARVAWWLGDDTASSQGRLTLNPLAHADPIGTFLMPIVAQLAGGLPLIGWARPVPVSPHRFTRRVSMHAGMALTAAAGPLSNLILTFLSVLGLRILATSSGLDLNTLYLVELLTNHGDHRTSVDIAAHLLLIMSFMNAGLCIFNLIPLPPLDGSRLLPPRLQTLVAPLQAFSYMVLLAIMWFAGGIVRIPVAYLLIGAFNVVGLPTEMLWWMVHGG
ncbi:MAG: site-2 protease family protein [Deltaproteobacteria bacterium]|nr:site-2 protease family protein [Deltaproteobacteria bacterium]